MAQTEQQVVKDPLKKCRKCKRIKRKCLCGHPTKKTREIVEELTELFRQGLNATEACEEAGIKRKTYYGWRERDKVFADRMDAARNYPNIIAKKQLTRLMLNPKALGHSSAVQFQLKNRAKDPETGEMEYLPTQKVQHSGHIRSDSLTEEQKQLLEKYKDVTSDELDQIEDEMYAKTDAIGSDGAKGS